MISNTLVNVYMKIRKNREYIYIYVISRPKKIESSVSVDGLLPVKFNEFRTSVACSNRVRETTKRTRRRRLSAGGRRVSTGLSQRNERSQREGKKKTELKNN